MSYILDALRRAEADRERERGQVPGLHTPPPSGTEAVGPRGMPLWLPWAGAGVLLLAGVGVGVWWAGSPNEAPPAASPPLVAAVAPPAPPVVPSVPVPAPAPSVSPYLPPVPAPAAVAPPLAAPQTGSAHAPPPASTPAPAAEAPLPRLSELPDSLRRDMPRLVLSGSVYSDDPASRFVIVNGEVVHEGASLGADFVLEQIRPRELVLRFRGQRFRQPV